MNTISLHLTKLKKEILKSRYLLLLVAPGVIFIFTFYYLPMVGISFAFTDYKIGMGIFQAPFVGFHWFEEFFKSIYFFRTFRNTLVLGVLSVIWGFPVPVVFALLLNEAKNGVFKRAVQSFSYLPHFISTVIIVGMTITFLTPQTGIIWHLVNMFGNTPVIMTDPRFFRTIYIASDIWSTFGWNSIMFLAALSSVDPQIYDSAKIDGANRWKQMLHVTVPSILPTILMLLVLRMGSIVDLGFEKVYLLQNPAIYDTADVISTYVYRRGIVDQSFSFGTAVGLFNSVINLLFLVISNTISKRLNETSLW